MIMLDNIYVVDVNTDALNGYRVLEENGALFWGIELQEITSSNIWEQDYWLM